MSTRPPIKLSRLRDIGWEKWDPINLLAVGETWDHKPFADEYDTYLLKVSGDLRRGSSVEEAAEYLMGIEREHMGLGVQPAQELRAAATARSIQNYLVELDDPGLTSV